MAYAISTLRRIWRIFSNDGASFSRRRRVCGRFVFSRWRKTLNGLASFGAGRLQPAQTRLPGPLALLAPVHVHSLEDRGSTGHLLEKLQRLLLGQRVRARHRRALILVRDDLTSLRRRRRRDRHLRVVRLAARNLELPDHHLELLRGETILSVVVFLEPILVVVVEVVLHRVAEGRAERAASKARHRKEKFGR